MGQLQYYQQVLKDLLKRKYVDFSKRGRLQTPMGMLVSILNAQGYLPTELIALEIFGMHGLWVTRDYASLCSYLELYEINPIYAKYAKIFIRNATVHNSDSIEAILKRQLKKTKYNYIVSDNPFSSPFGKGYYEHFDFFPSITDYMDSGILSLNFAHNIENTRLSKEHLNKREEFYGKANPSVKEAVEVYRKSMKNMQLVDYIFLPRNDIISFLAFVITRLDT